MSSVSGQLYAFNVSTGESVAGYPVATASNFGTPAVDAANNIVYALANSVLYAFNLNGTSAWTKEVGGTGNNYNVGPVVEGGFVYLKAGNTLKKYDSTGALKWSVESAGNDTQPAIMGGAVYVNSEAGQIRKYDAATGAEVTTGGFPISTASSQAGLAVANGKIFHKADQLYAYNASTGATAWTAADGGDSTFYDSPAVSNGVVYVYGWDSKLYAFDEATGAPVAGFPSAELSTPSDRNWSSPTVAGDKVFVGAGTSQKLKVLGAAGSANAGKVQAEYPTFSADTQGFDLTSPIVSGGVVLAMLDGGGLYAFSTGNGSVGKITINGGAACTESRSVTLTIDPGPNTEMRISEDPLFSGVAFEPVATSKPFTLSSGFGTKTVYIQFKDSSGQLSNVFNAKIEYAASCSGITLAPETAENPVGTTHTVTATVTEEGSHRQGATVTFTVTGANPQTGSGSTNASGEATFTYKGENAGTDTIVASFEDKTGHKHESNSVTKIWTSAKRATQLATLLSGGGQSGGTITVKEGSAVTDQATLSGENASKATGTVTYKVYSDNACTKEVAAAGEVTVTAGAVPPSNAETLAPGTYYWQASYSGDASNEASKSVCGSEVETVTASKATCSKVAGEGVFGEGQERQRVRDNLSTNLASTAQKFTFSWAHAKKRYALKELEAASCVIGKRGGRVFKGRGEGTLNGVPEFLVRFVIKINPAGVVTLKVAVINENTKEVVASFTDVGLKESTEVIS
jgi:outer membrane protein assembly factor BamB